MKPPNFFTLFFRRQYIATAAVGQRIAGQSLRMVLFLE